MDLTCKLHILQDLRQAQNARKENELKFCTLKEASTAEIVEKKSRFIANSCHIESKEEAEEKINLIKKKYYDAKHNCFAFSIVDKDGNLLEKSSDDGEPSGTAGAPILNVIRKNNKESLDAVYSDLAEYFNKQGGFKREDAVLDELGGKNQKPYVLFLLTLGENFSKVSCSLDGDG